MTTFVPELQKRYSGSVCFAVTEQLCTALCQPFETILKVATRIHCVSKSARKLVIANSAQSSISLQRVQIKSYLGILPMLTTHRARLLLPKPIVVHPQPPPGHQLHIIVVFSENTRKITIFNVKFKKKIDVRKT